MEQKTKQTERNVTAKKVTITRLRTGCWTCRRRGYRCDEAKPGCNTCKRLAVPCEGYGVRLKWKHGRSTGRTRTRGVLAQDTPGASVVSLTPEPVLATLPGYSATDVFLLQHYFFTVSSLLSSTPDRTLNTYLSTVLPLMMQHDYLMSTALALSAVHLSSRYPDRFALYGDRLKGDGMRGLINRLGQAGNAPWDEGVLATIIMFGLLEVFEANASLWSQHLVGASSFLSAYLARCGSPSPAAYDASPTLRKLLEIFAYHEVLASVALRRAPRLPASFLRGRQARQRAGPYVTNSGDRVQDTAGTWSAFAEGPERRSVFLSAVDSLLSLVAELARIRSAPNSSSAQSAHSEAATVLQRLRRWRCPDAQYSVETRNTAEAMRQAGILFYYSSVDLAMAPRTDVDEAARAVDIILDCLRGISVKHSAVASHVWPLYMAGMASTHKHQRACIRDRLDEMMDVRGIRSIVQVKETLARLWSGQSHHEELVLF